MRHRTRLAERKGLLSRCRSEKSMVQAANRRTSGPTGRKHGLGGGKGGKGYKRLERRKSEHVILLQTRSRARWPPARTSTPTRAWGTWPEVTRWTSSWGSASRGVSRPFTMPAAASGSKWSLASQYRFTFILSYPLYTDCPKVCSVAQNYRKGCNDFFNHVCWLGKSMLETAWSIGVDLMGLLENKTLQEESLFSTLPCRPYCVLWNFMYTLHTIPSFSQGLIAFRHSEIKLFPSRLDPPKSIRGEADTKTRKLSREISSNLGELIDDRWTLRRPANFQGPVLLWKKGAYVGDQNPREVLWNAEWSTLKRGGISNISILYKYLYFQHPPSC